MEIQSAFNAGVQGFNKAQEDATEAASEIARETNYVAEQPEQGQTVNDNLARENTSSGDVSNLNQEVVNLKVAEFQAKASSEVVQSADETLGTILDVTV